MHRGEVVGAERAVPGRRCDRDHRDDALAADQGDERRTLRAYGLREPLAHDGRARRVVHGKPCRLEHRARDARRLAREIDAHVAPPVEVASAGTREESRGFARIVRDEREPDEPDIEQRADLVEQRARDPSTSCARASSAAIRRRLCSSRALASAPSPRRRGRMRRAVPISRPRRRAPSTAATLSHAVVRPVSPREADSIVNMLGAADCTERSRLWPCFRP